MERLTWNPRVSVFRQDGSIYLYDPVSRTCASMNSSMLAWLEGFPESNPDLEAQSIPAEITELVARLRRLGILIPPEASAGERQTAADDFRPLSYLTIFVTTKCNLRCAYCYANGGDSGKTIGKETWTIAMEHFFSTLRPAPTRPNGTRSKLNLTIHGGGEPTTEFAVLREIVDDFRGRARAMGFEPAVGMGTNGTYDDSVHRWIVENNIGANFSLDGPPAIQNRLRPFRSGQASYDVVAANIQRLVSAGRQVSIRATIPSDALESMAETVETARQLGIGTVHFEPVTLTGRCAAGSLARPSADAFADAFLKCYLQGLEHDINVTYSGLRCFQGGHSRFCAACGQNYCVTPDGNITTCFEVLDLEDPAASEFIVGKVDPIEKRVILDEAKIDRLKQRVGSNMEGCRNCFIRTQCAGDCPVKGFRYSGEDLYSPDPYRCRIAERINKQLIVWLADGVIECRDARQSTIVSVNRSQNESEEPYGRTGTARNPNGVAGSSIAGRDGGASPVMR
ncbi:MAG: radical SAM protein [Terracidiphilus sp.]